MRIGYVLEQFPKLSETFILEEMLELERLGVDLTVFALSDSRESQVHEKVKLLKAEVVRAGVAAPPCLAGRQVCGASFLRQHKMLRLQTIRAVGPKKWFWGMRMSSWLAAEAKKKGIDHLHAHFAGDAAFVAMLASRISGIPYSFTVHAGGIFGWPYLIKEKIAGAKFVVSISEFNKKYLTEKYQLSTAEVEKIEVIHCGIDLSRFSLPSHHLIIPARLAFGDSKAGGSSSRPSRILTVARLEEKKGHKYLLEGLKILESKKISFHAALVGGGVLENELKNRARSLGLENEVTFIGAITQNEVHKLLVDSDAFVLPCVKAKNGNMDGIPVSLMEAMAVGVPVVSTRLSGIPELIEDGKTGLLVEPENAVELAEAIEKILTGPELRSRLVQQARIKVEEEFDVRKNAKQLARILLR